MAEADEDRQKAIDAEMKLRFVEDASRLVDQMGIESHRLSAPIKERRKVNHFMEDWDARFKRKRAVT